LHIGSPGLWRDQRLDRAVKCRSRGIGGSIGALPPTISSHRRAPHVGMSEDQKRPPHRAAPYRWRRRRRCGFIAAELRTRDELSGLEHVRQIIEASIHRHRKDGA
jgi:hypothetical protein